jgi:hypothetical protein
MISDPAVPADLVPSEFQAAGATAAQQTHREVGTKLTCWKKRRRRCGASAETGQRYYLGACNKCWQRAHSTGLTARNEHHCTRNIIQATAGTVPLVADSFRPPLSKRKEKTGESAHRAECDTLLQPFSGTPSTTTEPLKYI